MNKGEGGNEEDAMFSKKPLGGLSCASCEKYLVNMMGKKVEYMPWQKLPFRDPAERIARVGQGFSKMLSMINPDQLSRYEQAHSQIQHNSNMEGTTGENPFNEHYQAMGQGQNERQTHNRFPQTAGSRFVSDQKRPGSAGTRKKGLPAVNTRGKK